MNVQRTQGYGQGFGMNPTELLVKSNVKVSRQPGRAVISGALNYKGQRMSTLTLTGKDLTDNAIVRFLRKQQARLAERN